MTKFLRLTSLVATAAAFALTASEAAAAPVSATSDATAKARIVKPLVLKSTQNFDLGIIVLTGAGPYTATVSLNKLNTFNCDGNSGNVTCSGTHTRASYNVAGTQGQNVTIASGPVLLSDGVALTPDLTLNSGPRHHGDARQFGRAGKRLLGRRFAQRSEHRGRRRVHGHLRPDRRLSVRLESPRLNGRAEWGQGVAGNRGPFFLAINRSWLTENQPFRT